MRLELCRFCGRKFVPELLLATVDVPDCLPCVGAACSVQARVCRVKKNLQGEASATAGRRKHSTGVQAAENIRLKAVSVLQQKRSAELSINFQPH